MVEIMKELCIGCGVCVRECPVRNLTMENEKASVKRSCMECGHCFAICPKKAISIPDYPADGIIEFENQTSPVSGDEFLRLIKSRRSIRDYQEKNIAKETWEKILEAGRFTATGGNGQDLKYVVVQDDLETIKNYVWDGFAALIEQLKKSKGSTNSLVRQLRSMNAAHLASRQDDRLFFNAPSLLVITSSFPLDGGLAASNIELMAHAEGLGVLFSGFIQRALALSEDGCNYLGIEKTQICACMLLGYPNVTYRRTVPRKAAQITWK